MQTSVGNGFAFFALFSWPLIAFGFFRFMRLEKAAIWSLLAGYLLLPAGTQVDLPLLPPLNKFTVTTISTTFMCLVTAANRPSARPGWLIGLLLIAFVLAPVATTFGNSYELRTGGLSIPGYYLMDGIKGGANNLVQLGSFYVGMRFLTTPESRVALLKALVVAALIYSLPILFEVRFSPQLHRWVYGYFPHSFAQQMRAGGFRPVVFLQHGLHVALFIAMSVIACCAAVRMRWSFVRVPAAVFLPYLGGILVLCKTLGAVIYAALLSPVLLLCRPKLSVKVASGILVFTCAYPAIRSHGVAPIAFVQSVAQNVSSERAASFDTRVSNEDQLLRKANQKAAFGWGGWGRNRIFSADSGRDISVTDGGWIIAFGMFGWLGYLSLFGLLAVPVLRLNGRSRSAQIATLSVAGLSLLLAINVLDAIPNDNITPMTFLIAGTIAGCRSVKPLRSSRNSEHGVGGAEPVLTAHGLRAFATCVR